METRRFISIIIVAAAVLGAGLKDALGEEGVESRNSCSYKTCIACGSKTVDIIKKLQGEYGRVSNIYGNLLQISEGKTHDIYNQDFYDLYGIYFLEYETFRDKGEVVAKHLLSKGVHPYWSLNTNEYAALGVLSSGDKGELVLQEIVSSGKLMDCPSELGVLKKMAKALNLEKAYGILNQ